MASHNHNPNRNAITPTTLPSPFLRKAAILSFLPALPLCITHAALANDNLPALGLIPLFFSAAVSLFLLLRARRTGSGKGKGKGKVKVRWTGRDGGEDDLEGLLRVGGRGGDEDEGEREGVEERLAPDEDEDDDDGDGEEGGGEGGTSVLTHRILVFVVDVILAGGLMVVLVFTWIRTGHGWMWPGRRPELVMLAAYGTMPLLINFLIHAFLAVREFGAGLAIPGLVEYTAWRAVPPDCPHCGTRLRPDSLPSIPWYETVSRPRVSLPHMQPPSISRPSLPGFKAPKFSGLKGREWKVPSWMKGRNPEYAPLLVDGEQDQHGRYNDGPDRLYDEPSTPVVVATG